MKKFVLIIICAIVILFLVIFNYLLWDRDSKVNELNNLKHDKVGNTQTINILSMQLAKYEDDNNLLVSKIGELNETIKSLKDQIIDLENLIEENKETITQKDELIMHLTRNVSKEYLSNIFSSWIEMILNNDVNDVYSKLIMEFIDAEKVEYTALRGFMSGVSNISIVSLREPVDEEIKDYEGRVLVATIEVIYKEGSDEFEIFFINGVNSYFIYFEYDLSKNVWKITEIKNT